MEPLKQTMLELLRDVAPRAYAEHTEQYGAVAHPFPDIDFEDLADRLREFIDWYGQGR